MTKRKEQIDAIIEDLHSLKENGYPESYAIDRNLEFFNAAKSRLSYLQWVFGAMRKVDGSKLLELADLPLPKWDKQLHSELSIMSRKDFPGMLKPLLNELLIFIEDKKPKVLLDLGCGSMEIVRQLLLALEERGVKEKLIIIGVDRSSIVPEMVKGNFTELDYLVDLQFNQSLSEIEDLHNRKLDKHLLIVTQEDIFGLKSRFSPEKADLVFHSRFKHHLSYAEAQNLDQLIKDISHYYIEFDEYQDLFLIPIQSLATWQMPVLMNGAVFSRLRELKKQDIIKGTDLKVEKIAFNGLLGTYLKTNIK